MARLGRFACRGGEVCRKEKKELCADCTPAKDGRRAGQLKTPDFQPFLVGERIGEGIACKYKLV
jgi:hypothetical protein